ncbi:hypothetical protein BGZ96_012427 [Linnemannia gamsii]|uniref:Ndc10 domain-containing protein n=1 Tax=Linnemannia gamsii TaxID=64522 RepID=A0ABQ7JQF0_9FUNG|nr:hypothetical protein BGZ96_012427 [Linnemannia gamsii]
MTNAQITILKDSIRDEDSPNVTPTDKLNSVVLTRELPRRAARTAGGERIHEQYQLKGSWKKHGVDWSSKDRSDRNLSASLVPRNALSTPLKRRKYSDAATGFIDRDERSGEHDQAADVRPSSRAVHAAVCDDNPITKAIISDKDPSASAISPSKQYQSRESVDSTEHLSESLGRMYSTEWRAWCASRDFSNGVKVTGEKLLTYMNSLIRKVDPEARSYHRPRGRAALDLMYYHFSELQQLYLDQCAAANVIIPDLEIFLKIDEVELLLHRYQEEINEFYRKQDTEDSGQLWNEHHYIHGGYPWVCITRSRLHLTLNDAFGGLTLSFNKIMLKDLYSVHFCGSPKERPRHLRSGIAISHPPGNSIRPGACYLLLKRHEDVEVCSVGSLAFYLHAVWTSAFSPDILADDWKQSFLLFTTYINAPGNNDSLETTCNKLVEKARHRSLNKVTITTSKSWTDPLRDITPRASGMGATRCSGQVLQGTLFPSYLSLRKRDAPYKLKYASADNDKPTSPPQRSVIIPPATLQREIFPFIEDLFPGNADWAQWIDNIMMDQDEGTNRVVDWRKGYQELDRAETIRLALVLAHLRKVVLQDYVVLMASDPDELNLSAHHHLARQHRSFLSQPFKEFTVRLQNAILSEQAPIEVEDDDSMSELVESNTHPSKVLTAVIAAVSAIHVSEVSVAAGTGQLQASTASQGQSATVVDSTSTNTFPAPMEITPSIDTASDQGLQHRNGTATLRNNIRHQVESFTQDSTKSFLTPAGIAPRSNVSVLDQDFRAETHGKDISPTHRGTTPTMRTATTEVLRGDTSPTLVASPTSTNQSPTETTSINMQTTKTEQDSTARLDEHKSSLSKLSDQFSVVIEATLTTMSDQFVAELKATRATMMSQLAKELEVTRTAMKSQLATEFETARADMRNQLFEELEETRMSMNNQLLEGFVATQTSVDGVHLRMAEIERSIRGLWATMAAERANPRRSLLHANDNRGSRSRSRSRQRPRYKDNDMQEGEQEEEVEGYQGMQEDSDTMLQDTDDNEHINLQEEDTNNNGDGGGAGPESRQTQADLYMAGCSPEQQEAKPI